MSTQEQQQHIDQRPFAADARWYIVQTKPRQERKLVTYLTARTAQIETFLPRIEVILRHAGYRVAALEPLFPTYVFVHMPLTPRTWGALRWTPGARRILGDGDGPLAVPDELVKTIRTRVEPLGFVRVGLQLVPGTRVRVRTGPFAGLEAIFERPTSRNDRVRVLLEILGSVRPLEIDPLDLERV